MHIATLLLVNLALSAQAPQLCKHYSASPEALRLKKQVNEKIRQFSEQASVAKRADLTLAKLQAAKSAGLQDWLKKHGLTRQNADKVKAQWRLTYATQFMLTQFPHGETDLDQEIARLADEVNHIFATPSFRARQEALFAQAKKRSLAVIESLPISAEDKKQIRARVEKIRLYWMRSFKDSKYSRVPLDFLDWGIAYDPVGNEINLGVNAVNYAGDATVIAVYAHEIGHAFDSCRWGAGYRGVWPFQKVGECLRSDQSVGAKKRDDSQWEVFAQKSPALARELKDHPTCNKLGYPAEGLQADQLLESFADWFAAEVAVGLARHSLKNLRADLCEGVELRPGSSYPSHQLRLEGIYYAHPKLHDLHPDMPPHAYCAF